MSLRNDENPTGKPALEASYKQTPGLFALMNHRIANIDLGKCDRLSFDVASDKDAQLAVSIEMAKVSGKGARYTYLLEVAGGKNSQHQSIPFTEFALDQNSPPDPAGKFDSSKMRTISVMDVTGAAGNETTANTLWLADVRAMLKQ